MENLPAGAKFDSNAPFNQTEDYTMFCPNCDRDLIESDILESTFEEDFKEEFEKALDEARKCNNCIAEDKADMSRD